MELHLETEPSISERLFCCLVLSKFDMIVFYLMLVSLRSNFLIIKDKKRVDSDGRGSGVELGGREEEETAFRVYYIRKKYI